MTRILRIALASAILLFAVALGTVAADELEVKANVPFAFVAAEHSFEPGNYAFVVEESISPNVLTIHPVSGAFTRITLTEAGGKPNPSNESRVVFDKFRGRYYLAEVWVAGLDQGRVVPKSEIEHEEALFSSAITIRGNK